MSEEDDGEEVELRDVTSLATWSVSSAKVGNGVLQLLDGDTSTCWQSDDFTPHMISATFPRRVFAKEVQIYVNHEADESYTPAKIELRICTGLGVVQANPIMNLDKPKGWISQRISPVRGVFSLEIGISANHQSGRDTHIRGVRVLEAPRKPTQRKFSSAEYNAKTITR